MASTTFIDYSSATPVVAAWLNDVNSITYSGSGYPRLPLTKLTDFGVNLNGGTVDISSALQTAINTVLNSATGGDILFPPGNYLLSQPVNIPKNTSKSLRLVGFGGVNIFSANAFPSTVMFNCGQGSTAAGGMDIVFQGLNFINGASNTTLTVASLLNMNGIQFVDCQFGAFQNGVTMNACYATRYIRCQWNGTLNNAVYSSTSAHNIVFDSCKAFGVGGTNAAFLKIDVATNNIVIQNSDFEQCASVYNLASGCTSIRVVGTYIEYCVNLEFFHAGVCNQVHIEDCWIALNTGTPMAYQNIQGGTFAGNTLYNQAFTWAGTVLDMDVGDNVLLGTATLAPANFQTSIAYLNNWTSASHTFGYKKNRNGTVQLQGQFTAGTGSIGNTAVQLPLGYRPTQQNIFACITTNNKLVSVVVDPVDGNVVPNVVGGAVGDVVNLDGIIFVATHH